MNKWKDYEQTLRAMLSSAGLKMTRQRRLILNILISMDDHPSAFEIFKRASKVDPTISLSTIYRTMKTLEEHGTVHRHTFSGEPSRFEQADGKHHDHLIDIETGQIIEFSSNLIEQLQEEIAHSLGYNVIHHRFELYGKKQNSSNNVSMNGVKKRSHNRV
ncbi:Fur family transcriptional regulator [Bartonella ancashensis]|uniref:Ferric uptake regulation protein n=1 Tax=Bartonella ancashensis TaxID=1318743 RepID=A0A0M3T397_9HYPH|nr:Fur family transcriptional regulator [Bartonella ancashensis]ALE04105.1 Manganese uptake regulation protein MUR [Bartonella ancashensis]